MRDVFDYLAKVTREHAGQPDFISMLAMVLQPFSDAQLFLKQLPEQFDLDTAIGAQLDVDGQWIGRSRNIKVPVANSYFTFDDPLRGWDRGVWKGPFADLTGLVVLDDETYRDLLFAKCAANHWDGTIGQAQRILTNFFAASPGTLVFIEDKGDAPLQINYFTFDDNSPLRGFDEGVWFRPGDALSNFTSTDMLMIIGVSGQIPSIVFLSILAQNLIPLKPPGVRLDVEVTSVNGIPLFGFDVGTAYVAGFDQSSWGVPPSLIPNLSI
jgi:hypothetical protein